MLSVLFRLLFDFLTYLSSGIWTREAVFKVFKAIVAGAALIWDRYIISTDIRKKMWLKYSRGSEKPYPHTLWWIFCGMPNSVNENGKLTGLITMMPGLPIWNCIKSSKQCRIGFFGATAAGLFHALCRLDTTASCTHPTPSGVPISLEPTQILNKTSDPRARTNPAPPCPGHFALHPLIVLTLIGSSVSDFPPIKATLSCPPAPNH
ncbi:predicted protein [Aspergillus nidulans FGSC A4]|uniref:Uncharacterized protein n=1 Tax=Emericella nidulans (strain FGSC A4 / ATCC 38163 / CBS 112.46 / NRRL 194 / M139) TaxID=227321 RepID=Q5AXC6_EMENI|nr:hypothetical protein [Aspergillus nidulans FGSC A4]EAA61700.1 predicted protein [Aspergillus nidulans FGSC A4]CBF79178.1 TPA: hypothetical protein ANIA_07054 [Aspergillus nidulans FGSC A4]|eukprot:XP_664658.1 predicted protein [Aspergillus nidulans FGSC A4]